MRAVVENVILDYSRKNARLGILTGQALLSDIYCVADSGSGLFLLFVFSLPLLFIYMLSTIYSHMNNTFFIFGSAFWVESNRRFVSIFHPLYSRL